jgi:hypothetical protein
MAAVGTSAVVVPTAYKTLIKVLAHSFYDGDCPPKEDDKKDKAEGEDEKSQKRELTPAQQKKVDQVRLYVSRCCPSCKEMRA